MIPVLTALPAESLVFVAPSVRGPFYGEGGLFPRAVFVSHKNNIDDEECQKQIGKAKERWVSTNIRRLIRRNCNIEPGVKGEGNDVLTNGRELGDQLMRSKATCSPLAGGSVSQKAKKPVR